MISKLAAGLDKRNWFDIKQLLFSEFSKTNIELIICDYNNNPHSPNRYHIEKDVSNIKNNTNDKNEN